MNDRNALTSQWNASQYGVDNWRYKRYNFTDVASIKCFATDYSAFRTRPIAQVTDDNSAKQRYYRFAEQCLMVR